MELFFRVSYLYGRSSEPHACIVAFHEKGYWLDGMINGCIPRPPCTSSCIKISTKTGGSVTLALRDLVHEALYGRAVFRSDSLTSRRRKNQHFALYYEGQNNAIARMSIRITLAISQLRNLS